MKKKPAPREVKETCLAVRQVKLDHIIPNRFQPRKTIEKESLQELIDSIKTHGVLEPILVRQVPGKEDCYEIIMGERRFRSCQALNKETIPAIIKEADDCQMLEWAIIENIQRKDLNPIERAKAYQQLTETFHLTQEEVARRVGAERSTVTNFIRLLGLPLEIQEDIMNQKITLGHALVLLSIPDSTSRLKIWERIKNEALSIRNLRIIVDAYLHPRGVATGTARAIQYRELHAGNDPTLRECAAHLWKKFDTRVEVRFFKMGDKVISGMIMIHLQSEDDLQRIMKNIG